MKKALSLLLVFAGAFAILGQGLTIRSAFYLPSIKPSTGGGAPTYSFIASASASAASSTTATTGNIDTTGAKLIVISCSFYQSGTFSLTDSKGNTWTALNSYAGSGGNYSNQLFYAVNPTVGSGHNFSLTANYVAIAVQAFGFTGTTPTFDAQNGAADDSGSITTIQTGTVTPAGNNELFVSGFCGGTTAGTPTIDSSFTKTESSGGGGATVVGACAYKIQTSSGAENPTWTFTTGNPAAATLAAFK